MSEEFRAAQEGFLTQRALVGFLLLGVNSAVLSEVSIEAKGSATHFTGIRLLPSVHAVVVSEIGLLGKGFPTISTDEGLLSRVHSLVHHKA